jgi:hypothetical protein
MGFQQYYKENTNNDPLEQIFGKEYNVKKIKVKNVLPSEITHIIPEELKTNNIGKYLGEYETIIEQSGDMSLCKISTTINEVNVNLYIGVRQHKKENKYSTFIVGDKFKDNVKKAPLLKENKLFGEVELLFPTEEYLKEAVKELFASSKIHKVIDFYKTNKIK